MATAGNRDVRLGVEIETIGEDGLKRMADDVRRLAKEGGDAAPEFARLAEQLDRLASQAGALEAFKVLATEVDALTAAQRAAGAAAAELGDKLDAQRAKTAAAGEVQAKAKADVIAAKDALNEQKRAIETLAAETDAAGKKLASYIAQQRAMAVELVRRKTALDDARIAQREANAAASAAVDAEKPLTKQYDDAAAALTRANDALQKRSAALRGAEAATVAAGASTTDLAQAEAALLAETQRLNREVGEVGVRVWREQYEADRDAALQKIALAEATEAGQQALAAELLTIKEAEEFTRKFAAAQRAAATEALRFVEAEEAAAIAADKAARRVAELNAQAEKTKRDADYVRAFEAALDDVDAKAKAATASTERLAKQALTLKDAFGQTGVRSMQAIVEEMQRVGSSLSTLKAQYAAGAISAADLDRATSSAAVRIATLRTELQTIPALPNVFEKINSSVRDVVNRFGALSAAIATFAFAARPVLEADIAFETLRRTLTFVTGSAQTANEQIAFLRKTANDAGLSAGALSEQFSLFEASLLKSGQSLDTTQRLFGGVAAAAGVLGISSERTGNILLALGQTANKGKVSLEELQGQIGEALPGALKLAADSLGITTAELGKLLKDGKLLAEDFLPAFAGQLLKTFDGGAKPVDTLTQSFNRLKNAANVVITSLVDTSGYRALNSALDSLARNFDTVVGAAGSVVKGFLAIKAIDMVREFTGLKAAAELAAAGKLKDAAAAETQAKATAEAAVAAEAEAVALDRSTLALERNAVAATTAAAAQRTFAGTAMAAIEGGFVRTATAVQSATARVGGFVATLGGPYGAALAVAATFSDQLGNGIAKLAAKATGAAQALEKNEQKLRDLAAAEHAAYEARRAAAEQEQASFVQLQVRLDKQADAAEKQVKVSEKLVKAKREEGEAATTLATLSGYEVRGLDAHAAATGAVEAAIRSQLAAQQQEVDALKTERTALAAASGAQETWSAARKQFFVDFDQEIKKKEADLELTKQQAESEGAAADAAFLAARKYRDNATELEKYRLAVDDAKVSLAAMRKAQQDGLTTTQNVRNAERNLAVAEGLLKDAYDDATRAIQRRQQALREQVGLNQQDITLQRTRAKNEVEIADLTGQYVDHLAAAIKLKEIDVDATRQKVKADNDEAALLRQEAALMQQRLELGDPLYAQKKREIDSTLAAAQAKANEGLIEQENIKKLNIELGILNGTLYQSVKGFNDLAAASGTAAANLTAVRKAGGQENKLAADGGKDLSAPSIQLPGGAQVDNTLPFLLQDKAEKGLLSVSDLGNAQKALAAAKNNAILSTTGVQSLVGGADAQAWVARLTAIVDKLQGMALLQNSITDPVGADAARALALQYLKTQGINTSGVTSAGEATKAGDVEKLTPTGAIQIDFNLGGKRYSVQSKSRDEAENLVRALEDAFKLALGG